MGDRSREELQREARKALRPLGYWFLYEHDEELPCSSLMKFSKEGRPIWVLLQTRDFQETEKRYRVGIMWKALSKADEVVVYFSGETKFLRFPPEFLLNHFRKSQACNDSGVRENQWSVDFRLNENTMSAQGSGGERIKIDKYVTLFDQTLTDSIS